MTLPIRPTHRVGQLFRHAQDDTKEFWRRTEVPTPSLSANRLSKPFRTLYDSFCINLVPKAGLEPARLVQADGLEPPVSTNFTTSTSCRYYPRLPTWPSSFNAYGLGVPLCRHSGSGCFPYPPYGRGLSSRLWFFPTSKSSLPDVKASFPEQSTGRAWRRRKDSNPQGIAPDGFLDRSATNYGVHRQI